MNVRDPFNVRNLNRNPIATWKSNPNYNRAPNDGLATLQTIIRTAATATQSAAADLRDKAGEVVQSAQHALSEVTALSNKGDQAGDDEEAQKQRSNKNKPRKHRDSNAQPTTTITTSPPGKRTRTDEDMSFTVPKNVPSFSDPQRQLEDRLWAASSSSSSRQRSFAAGGSSSSRGGVLGGVQELLSPRAAAALPMYKDKPYGYYPAAGRRGMYRRKRTCGLLLLVVVGLVWWTGLFAGHQERAVTKLNQWGWLRQEGRGGAGRAKSKADWLKRRERVVEAMELSWDAYERYAWGT